MLHKCLLVIFACIFMDVNAQQTDPCQLVTTPQEVLYCVTEATAVSFALSMKDYRRACTEANGMQKCFQGLLKDCIAERIGRGLLNEVEYLTHNCCPNRNAPTCSLRETAHGRLSCFPGDSLVTLFNGTRKEVWHLQPGDEVLSYDAKDKTAKPSRVLTMIHKDMNQLAFFIQVTTVTGQQLTLSSNHLVLTKGQGYLMAKNVRAGMEVFVLSKDNSMFAEVILKVSEVLKQGYAAPLTQSGTIIVDGVAASCYATIDSHVLAHAALTPMRWWYSLFGGKQVDMGVHWFPQMIYNLTAYLLPSILDN